MGWEEKASKAKKGHRPSLKNWERDNLAETFPPYAQALLNSKHPYRSFRVVHNRRDNNGAGQVRGEVVERSAALDDVLRHHGGEGRIGNSNGGSGRYHGNDYHGDGNRKLIEDNDVMYPIVLDAATTPSHVFHKEYEAKCIPVVIRGIPFGDSADTSDGDGAGNANNDRRDRDSDCVMTGIEEEEKKECDNHHHQQDNRNHKQRRQYNSNSKEWPAIHRWKLDALMTDPDLSERPLKCGEDDDGYTIRMKLRHFLQYLHNNRDDSPLYIFDATFDEDRCAKRILDDYTVPEYFNEDLLGLVGERRRPPYRWFLVGPCRSGTTVHIDPLGTSAWNTLVHGVKRWVLFPPHVPKSVVKGRKLILPGEDDEAIHYFTTILPRMKRKAASCGGKGEYANFECYEFTQFAGETVFVPHDWWHAVLNVTHTVGITQNYCSRRNFDEVWTQTRSGRKKMSCSWLRRLQEQYPDLARRAKELNRRDSFVMWEDDEEAQRKWRKKKAEKERKKKERKADKERKKKEKWGEHRTTERRDK